MTPKLSTSAMEEFDVLHQARVHGSFTPSDHTSETIVAELVSLSFLVPSRMGYILSSEGLRAHGLHMEKWRASADIFQLERTYERFLSVNAEVKAECSRWQVSSRDEAALFSANDTLLSLLDRVAPALRRAGRELPRFEAYSERLARALQTAREGDARFITDPTVDSFHSAWFECHEDYLLTLGRSREAEGSH